MIRKIILCLLLASIDDGAAASLSTLSLWFRGYSKVSTSRNTPLHLRLYGGSTTKSVSDIKGHVIGIDLGTTYSCVSVWKNGRVEVCPNEQGNRITPSYVAWDDKGNRLVGDAAKNQAASNPINTVFDVKRLIGRKYSDSTVQKDSKLFPFKGFFYINIYFSNP